MVGSFTPDPDRHLLCSDPSAPFDLRSRSHPVRSWCPEYYSGSRGGRGILRPPYPGESTGPLTNSRGSPGRSLRTPKSRWHMWVTLPHVDTGRWSEPLNTVYVFFQTHCTRTSKSPRSPHSLGGVSPHTHRDSRDCVRGPRPCGTHSVVELISLVSPANSVSQGATVVAPHRHPSLTPSLTRSSGALDPIPGMSKHVGPLYGKGSSRRNRTVVWTLFYVWREGLVPTSPPVTLCKRGPTP